MHARDYDKDKPWSPGSTKSQRAMETKAGMHTPQRWRLENTRQRICHFGIGARNVLQELRMIGHIINDAIASPLLFLNFTATTVFRKIPLVGTTLLCLWLATERPR